MLVLNRYLAVTGWPCGCRDAFDVRNVKFVSCSRVKDDGAGKPADGNQAEQLRLAGLELKHRDGVLGAVADKKFFAGLSNASAFGCAPNRSPGFCRAQIVSTILSAARVNDAQRVAARVGDHEDFPFGETPARRRASRDNFAFGLLVPESRSITETEPSLAMKRPDQPAPACPAPPARYASARRPPPAPIADINFLAGERPRRTARRRPPTVRRTFPVAASSSARRLERLSAT